MSRAGVILFALVSMMQLELLYSFSVFQARAYASLQSRYGRLNSYASRLQTQASRLSESAASLLETTEDNTDYERFSRIHAVLEELKSQIPSLLSTPLGDSSSRTVYDESVKLVVEDSVLASSREELESLSTTLVLAVSATNQANSFLTTTVLGTEQSLTTRLESCMAIDPSVQAVRIRWKVNLPTTTGQQTSSQLQGVSQLELDPTTGKVSDLRLLQVYWNQERLNARAIGESLASLRQMVFAFENSPLIPGLPTLSSLLGSDFVQEVSRRQSSSSVLASSPLFVADSLETAFVVGKMNVTANTTLIPIDDYENRGSKKTNSSSTLPLPGSRVWNQYVALRKVFFTFCQETLPILSGNKSVPSQEMLELFSPQAILKATDGSELLRGKDPVGNFFHTVASWRKRSSGTWELTNPPQLFTYENNNTLKIAVDYRATSSLPGSPSPVVIEGTDHFVLETLDDNAKVKDQTKDDDTEGKEDVEILIKRVEQRKLRIVGGVSRQDGLWFMKSFVAAMDTGKFSQVGADSVIMDLLQRVIAGEGGRSGAKGDTNARRKRRIPAKLSESTAARVYGMMASLHQDVPSLFDKDMRLTYQLPPLHEYMSKAVELRGYLGETLARGLPSYNNAVGTTFGSLKGALASGSVKLEKDPSVGVELTAEGHVRLSLSVDLKVLPLPSGTSDLINSMSGNALSLPSTLFPLQIAVVSDYVIDKESGDIYQHRLVETRVNGQLTPGDVISRWMQKQIALNPQGSRVSTMPDGVAVVDIISWVRSMSRGAG